jgi:hypothetical protein
MDRSRPFNPAGTLSSRRLKEYRDIPVNLRVFGRDLMGR